MTALTGLVALVAGAAIVPRVRAANDAWDTTPATGNFTGTNWTTNSTTPGTGTGTIASGDSLYFGTSNLTTLTDDEATGFSFGGFTFNAGASAFTIGGNAFTLTGSITNNSSVLQTISDAFTVTNAPGFFTTTGNLTLGGNITETSTGVFLLAGSAGGATTGGGTVTLGGTDSFTASNNLLEVTGGSTLAITGTTAINLTSGNYFAIGESGASGVGTVTVASGGTMNVTGGSRFIVGTFAGGTFNVNGTANFASGSLLRLGYNGQSTVNLNSGGVIVTANAIAIDSATTGSTAAFNFNGGTLRAGAAGLNLLGTATGGLTPTVTTSSAASTIDANSFATSISAPIVDGATAGGLTITDSSTAGGGSVTLSGANTYSGPTAVNSGSLYVNGSLNTVSAVSVASGARLGGTGTVGTATVASGGSVEGGQSNAGKLTLGGLTFSGNGTAFIGNLANYTASPAIAAGTLTANGAANSVKVTVNGAISGVGTYELFSYNGSIGGTGASAFALTTLPSRATGALDFSHAGLIDLNVTGTDFLIWSGATTNTWDTVNANWKLNSNGAAATYIDNPGDSVVFNDTAGAAHSIVNLNSGDVHPTSVTFNNSALSYVLQGANAIAGATGLTKTGTGTLTINNANTYTGTTALNAGTISLGNAGALGTTGTILMGGGTLQFTANNATDYSGRFSTAANQAYNIDTNGQAVTFATALTSTGGSLTKLGTGTLTLSGISTYTGGTVVNGGSLVLNAGGGAGAIRGAVTVGTGATLNLAVGDALGYTAGTSVTTINVNGGTVTSTAGNNEGYLTSYSLTGGTVAAGGLFRFNVGAATPPGITSLASATTSTFASPIDDFVGSGAASGNLTVNVAKGTTAGGIDLTISGVISDNGGLTKNGSGYLNLTGQNTFTGPVNVTAGTLNIGNGGTGTASALGADSTTKAVTVSAGATLSGTINNWFGTGTQSSGGVSTLPTITLNGGTLSTTRYTAIGALNLNGGTVTAASTDNNANFQAFALAGNVTVGGTTPSTITSTNVGTNTGGYHLGNNAATNTTFTVATTGGSGPDLTVSAPLINQSGDFGGKAAGLTKAGAGSMMLTATSTYTGPTTVNAGSLFVSSTGSIVSGAVTANNSGTVLGGTGTINGAVAINSGAILLAGNTALATPATGTLTTGPLTLATGSTFNALLSSNTSISTLNAAGTTTLTGAAFAISLTPGASFTNGTVLQLITSNVTGMFTDNTYTAGGYTFTADYNADPGFFDVDIAVPEPTTYAILVVGMAGLIVACRRKINSCQGAVRS